MTRSVQKIAGRSVKRTRVEYRHCPCAPSAPALRSLQQLPSCLCSRFRAGAHAYRRLRWGLELPQDRASASAPLYRKLHETFQIAHRFARRRSERTERAITLAQHAHKMNLGIKARRQVNAFASVDTTYLARCRHIQQTLQWREFESYCHHSILFDPPRTGRRNVF